MQRTLTTINLSRIFLTGLTFAIFASSLTSLIINTDMKIEVVTAMVFGIIIISFLNIVAIRELRDIALDKGQPQETGFWICTAVYNLAVIILISKCGFRLF
ncbi:hypothetical protein KY317_01590 [Candidatus Woesearchaeota archaeon]|nr:hypothetical protein [Candidatus Woesearchaeota archaeon]